MKTIFVKDLKKDIQLSDEQFVIISSKKNLTKTGTTYFRLELGDKTGTITGNVWEDSIKNCDPEAMIEGMVVNVWGKVEEYKGAKQVKLLSISKALDYEIDNFVAVSDQDPEEMWQNLEQHIASVEDIELKTLLQKIFEDNEVRETFQKHPAAQNMHHAFRHGLLEHVLEMLDMADAILKYYPEADKSMVKTGAILHDIGKLFEIQDKKTTFDKTLRGSLIGHIVQGVEFLTTKIPEDFSKTKLVKLQHIILSHHGLLEYGSPVLPKTIEAIIVHQLDDSSAKIRIYQRVIRENLESDKEFSDKEYALGTDVYLR